MAVAVSGSPVPALSSPKPLFEPPELARYALSTYDVTRDGQCFVAAFGITGTEAPTRIPSIHK